MKILGLSFGFHDSAAALLIDGNLVACAQEERFSRINHDHTFPRQAINYCCQTAGILSSDLDAIAFYEKPYLKFHRALISHIKGFPKSFNHFIKSMPLWLGDRLAVDLLIKRELTYHNKVLFIPHHLAHTASAFLASPFEQAAFVISDGVGEWSTVSYGSCKKREIEIQGELKFPNSLGLLYTALTHHLGFKANGGEGKVMGLADWGEPTYFEALLETLDLKEDGSFKLDTSYWDFYSGENSFTRKFISTFGAPRKSDEEITPHR